MITLETILDKYGIEYKNRHRDVRSGWIGIVCPYCGRPGEYYLGINLQSLTGNCWRCGPHKLRDIFQTLKIPKQASATLWRNRETVQYPYPTKERSTGQYRPPRCVDISDAPTAFSRYLQKRKLDPIEVAELWGVQAIPPPYKYNWRLFIPVTQNDRPVSWTTRSINTDCPHNLRYLTSPPDREQVPIRSLLYGSDYCQHAVIVTEGPADAWSIGPGATATLGMTLDDQQIAAIARFPIRVIAFDNENRAQRRADKLCRRLAEFPGKTQRYEFRGKDANTASKKEIKSLRKVLS